MYLPNWTSNLRKTDDCSIPKYYICHSIIADFYHLLDLHSGLEMQYQMSNEERLVRAVSVRIVS